LPREEGVCSELGDGGSRQGSKGSRRGNDGEEATGGWETNKCRDAQPTTDELRNQIPPSARVYVQFTAEPPIKAIAAQIKAFDSLARGIPSPAGHSPTVP
jgi:hypothetical protein